MTQSLTGLWKELKPLVQIEINRANRNGGATSLAGSPSVGVAAHDLYGAAHTGTLDPSQAPWVATDIAAAITNHNAASDPHNVYVHISNARTITAVHTFSNGFTSPNADNTHYLGRAFVGYVGHSNVAALAHRSTASTTGYGFAQDASGASYINAASGQSIKHRINDTDVLKMTAGLLTMEGASAPTIKTDTYASQTTGWGITYAGAADFRYLFVDEMHAKSFIADLEQALAGGQIICKSVAVLYSNFTAPVAGGITNIVVRDLPSATGMAVFVNGDIIRIRQFSRSGGSLSISDCWGVAQLDTSYGTSGFDSATKTQRYQFTRSLGGNAGAMSSGTVIQADAIILDYGTSGNGFYEVNAIDGSYGANSPYSQIVTWTTHPHTGQSVMVRLGNLAGLGFTGEYGLYARGTSSSQYLLATGTSGILLRNTTFRQYDGSGNLFMQADTTGLNYYVQTAATFADNTSIWFRRTDGTKVFRLVGTNNSGSHVGSMQLEAGSSNSDMSIVTASPSGFYARTLIQNTVGSNSSQWYFTQLSDGTTKADFPGYIVFSGNPGSPTNHYGQIIVDPGNDSQDAFVSLRTTRTGTDRTWQIGAGSSTPNTNFRIYDYTASVDRINIDSNGATIINGYIGIAPASTSQSGLVINMPTSTSGDGMVVQYNGASVFRMVALSANRGLLASSFDNGSSFSGYFYCQRNSNGSTPSAGHILLDRKDGNYDTIWPDVSGNLRIIANTHVTNSNDTGGTVVGAQTSWHELKEDIRPHGNSADLLQAILDVQLQDFRMKSDTIGDNYTGIVITEQDRQDRPWYACNLGGVPALNERNLFGYLIGAIQAQQKMIEELKRNGDNR